MNAADRFKILERGLVAEQPTLEEAYAAAFRAIICLQELRRAMQDDSVDRLKLAELKADQVIKSAGFSL